MNFFSYMTSICLIQMGFLKEAIYRYGELSVEVLKQLISLKIPNSLKKSWWNLPIKIGIGGWNYFSDKLWLHWNTFCLHNYHEIVLQLYFFFSPIIITWGLIILPFNRFHLFTFVFFSKWSVQILFKSARKNSFAW